LTNAKDGLHGIVLTIAAQKALTIVREANMFSHSASERLKRMLQEKGALETEMTKLLNET